MERFSLPVDPALTLMGYAAEVDAPRCRVCMVHGVGDHFPRYQELVDTLCAAGCSVYGMDLPGHGESPGHRGYIGTPDTADRCITALIRASEARAPQRTPLVVFGHSMGGLLVLRYRHEHADCGAAVFLVCSPWLGLHFSFSGEERAEYARMVQEDPYCVHETKINPHQLYTKEPGRVIPRDPLMHAQIAYANILDRLNDIDLVFAAAGEKRAPVYIMAGSEDPICSVQSIQKYAAMEGDQCCLRVWPGLKHEPWNEPNRREVTGEMLAWLDRRIPARGACAQGPEEPAQEP